MSKHILSRIIFLHLLGAILCQSNGSQPLRFIGNPRFSVCNFSTIQWEGDRAPYSLAMAESIDSNQIFINNIIDTSITIRSLFLGGRITLKLDSPTSNVVSNVTDNENSESRCGNGGVSGMDPVPKGERGVLLSNALDKTNVTTSNTSFLDTGIVKQCQAINILCSSDMSLSASTVEVAGVPTTTEVFGCAGMFGAPAHVVLPFQQNETFFFSTTTLDGVSTSRHFTVVGEESDHCILISPQSFLSTSAPVSSPNPSQTQVVPQSETTPQPPSTSSFSRRAAIGGSVGGGVVVLLTITLILLRHKRRKRLKGIQPMDLDGHEDGHIEPNMILADTSHVLRPLVLPAQGSSSPGNPRQKDTPAESGSDNPVVATSQKKPPVRGRSNKLDQASDRGEVIQPDTEPSSSTSNNGPAAINAPADSEAGAQNSVGMREPTHIWHEDGGTAYDVAPIEHPPPYQQRFT